MQQYQNNLRVTGRHDLGFTMLELLVAVGIVILLVGLLLGGLKAASRVNDRRAAEATIAKLEAVLEELRNRQSAAPILVPPTTSSEPPSYENSLQAFVRKARTVESCARMLQAIEEFYRETAPNSGVWTVYDPWDNEIQMFGKVGDVDPSSTTTPKARFNTPERWFWSVGSNSVNESVPTSAQLNTNPYLFIGNPVNVDKDGDDIGGAANTKR